MGVITRSNDDLLLEAEGTNTRLDTLNADGAKEAKQDTANTSLGNIETSNSSIDTKLDDQATAAKQDDIITAIGSIGGGSATVATPTSVAQSTSSVQLLAAEPDRVEAIIRNDSSQTLYIQEGATATTTSAVELKKDDIYLVDNFTGVINGIWASGTSGFARITEKTTV